MWSDSGSLRFRILLPRLSISGFIFESPRIWMVWVHGAGSRVYSIEFRVPGVGFRV